VTEEKNKIPGISGKVKLLPSLLSVDFSRLGEYSLKALTAGAHGLHADVMDGRFVPPITFGADIVASVFQETGAWIDAHLMIIEPERQIESFAKAGVSAITVHAETCPHLNRVLSMIKESGCEAGVSFNPSTAFEEILRYSHSLLDRVLIMSVNPGWGGQSFIRDSLLKIEKVSQILNQLGSDAEIQVDGGVNAENIGEIVSCGATEIVAGTAVFKGDINENITILTEIIKKTI